MLNTFINFIVKIVFILPHLLLNANLDSVLISGLTRFLLFSETEISILTIPKRICNASWFSFNKDGILSLM